MMFPLVILVWSSNLLCLSMESMKISTKHLLIVEDDDLMRDELSHSFTQNGYGVSTAKNAKEAMVIALEKHPDLIVLDLLLPDMSGLEMLRKLRADSRTHDTPALILSNVKSEETLAEAVEVGGCDYLFKSDWSLEDVLKKVNEKFLVE